VILETIVTTCAADGRIHIAPMGIREAGGEIVLAPFRPSATLDNVLATRCAAISHTDDVRVFAGCLTGRREWPTVSCDTIPCMRLADCLAHREVTLFRVEEDPVRPRLVCRVTHEATHRPFRGFNRAQAAVIEAAILVSRLQMLPPEKIDREMEYLEIAVGKTAGPNEREAWAWINERIERHRREVRSSPA
jgi:hypothetical protein